MSSAGKRVLASPPRSANGRKHGGCAMSSGKLSALYSRPSRQLGAGSRSLTLARSGSGKSSRESRDPPVDKHWSEGRGREDGGAERAQARSRTPSVRADRRATRKSPRTGEADIDLTPEIPRSIDRRRYTWSRSPSPIRPPSPALIPRGGYGEEGAVAYSRWWRVRGLTHGLAAANPWVLVAAAAP